MEEKNSTVLDDETIDDKADKKRKIINKINNKIVSYFKHNVLFVAYFILMLANATVLRFFTVKNYISIKPMLADIAVIFLIGLFGYFIKPKKRFIYYMIWISLFSILSMANSIYYTNYKSFISVSLLSTASQLGGVIDAVTENILEAKDLVFLLSIVIYVFVYVYLRRKRTYFENVEKTCTRPKRTARNTFFAGAIFAVIFSTTLTGTDVSRLGNSWNREYVLSAFGLYTYTFSDLVTSTKAQLNVIFGEKESAEAFHAFYDDKEEADPVSDDNKYTDIFKGKNIIAIHAESIQQFTLDTKINGKELTPNLNKLAREGIYFSNFYAQESVGTSSDSEFTFSTSLMPASSGTVAINYCDRTYISIQKLLKEQGYYTFSMHGNNGSYWNRLKLHESLGYDKFYNYTTDYNIDERIGLGLSDKSFFKQSTDIVEKISKEHDKFYGTMIMLTNHTPFSDIENYSDFEVDFKYQKYNEQTGKYEEASAPFLEGTKLGSYFKSVHYADEAIGELIENLDSKGLLDNTVIVIYGDHDAKIKESEYNYYINYDPFTNTVLSDGDEGYIPIDEYCYNINRRVPFIIWSKDHKNYEPVEIDNVAGMYDVLPTLGNMFGFNNEYALGHDLFSSYAKDNIVVFPNANFITNRIYYSNSKQEYFDLVKYKNAITSVSCNQVYDYSNGLPKIKDSKDFLNENRLNYSYENLMKRYNDEIVNEEYIQERSEYAESRMNISSSIIFHDMIAKSIENNSSDTQTSDSSKEGNSTQSVTQSVSKPDKTISKVS